MISPESRIHRKWGPCKIYLEPLRKAQTLNVPPSSGKKEHVTESTLINTPVVMRQRAYNRRQLLKRVVNQYIEAKGEGPGLESDR